MRIAANSMYAKESYHLVQRYQDNIQGTAEGLTEDSKSICIRLVSLFVAGECRCYTTMPRTTAPLSSMCPLFNPRSPHAGCGE
jgi:hypothetical protein